MKKINEALARLLGWLEHNPVNRRASGSIPAQGMYLGCGFDPCRGTYQRQQADVSLSLSLFLSLSLSLHPLPLSENIPSGED